VKNFLASPHRKLSAGLVAIAIVALGVTVTRLNANSSTPQPAIQQARLQTEYAAVQVSNDFGIKGVEITSAFDKDLGRPNTVFAVRNVSSQPIASFDISYPSHFPNSREGRARRFYEEGNLLLAPGEAVRVLETNHVEGNRVHLVSVVYADGTAEGKPERVADAAYELNSWIKAADYFLARHNPRQQRVIGEFNQISVEAQALPTQFNRDSGAVELASFISRRLAEAASLDESGKQQKVDEIVSRLAKVRAQLNTSTAKGIQ